MPSSKGLRDSMDDHSWMTQASLDKLEFRGLAHSSIPGCSLVFFPRRRQLETSW
jgi:hypothetical protein